MNSANRLCSWLRTVAENLREVSRVRGRASRRRVVSELLEDRTLLSSVTADAFTVVSSGVAGQQNILHDKDWDAQAAPEWVGLFEGQRVVQTAGIDQKFISDDWVPIDVSKTYGLSGWARSGDNFGMRFSSLNQQSFGIEEYDADYLRIESIHVLKYGTASDTTLRAALNPGDTQILLTSAAGWSTSNDAGTRALAWYGYANKAGTTYANYTYTRNVETGGASGLWSPGGVNVAAGVITLNVPWDGPVIAAGAAVRNAVTSGPSHSTIALDHQAVGGDFSPSEHLGLIGNGVFTEGQFDPATFSPGTAFVRPVIHSNQHGLANNFVTWQDIRIQEFPVGTSTQNPQLSAASQPIIDQSVNSAGNQTVRLPLYSQADEYYPIGTVGRIRINPGEQYRLSVDALDISEDDPTPVGFYSFDSDGLLIHSLHVARHATAVDTRLARSVQPGDTAIYINDAAGWSNEIGQPAESRSLAWYGYRDSSGTLHADYDYTRNVAFDMLDGLWNVGGISFDAGVGAWKMTLRSAWTRAAIPSGTAVRNATGHDHLQLLSIPTDRYYGWTNDWNGTAIDNQDWFTYSDVIGGRTWQNGVPSETAFRPGTAFVQPTVKALVPHRYAVEFGPESDQALKQTVRQPTFGGQTLVTLERSRQWIESDHRVPVSPNLPTTISLDAAMGTTLNAGQTSSERHSIGFVPYDADGVQIESLHVARYGTAVDTTLAAALNPGDTQIVLTSSAGWSNIDVAGTRAIAWYGYRDSNGTLFADYSYTRNVAADVVNGLWNPGGISGNVITLRQPWSGPALAAGAAVRNAVDADALIPAVLDQSSLTNAWTGLSATVAGSWQNGVRTTTSLPPGTAAIRLAVRANEVDFSADTTIRVRNVRLTASTGASASLQTNNVSVATLDVLANDAALAGSVTISAVGTAKYGTVQIIAGGGSGGRDVIRYTSQAWFAGTDQFTYSVRNSSTGTVWTTTATVTVTADNVGNDPAPAALIAAQANDPANHAAPPISHRPLNPLYTQTQVYDAEQGRTLVANDLPLPSLRHTATDANNDVFAYRLVSGASHGTLRLRADGTFEYTPEAGFEGMDSFEYLVTDGLSEYTRRTNIRTWATDVLLSDRMRKIALAFHNFHDHYTAFGFPDPPNPAHRDSQGHLHLSWRVYLLPFLGYQELYEKFRLNEPWDSANNLPLMSQMPDVFRSPGQSSSSTTTRFQTISDLQDLGSSSSDRKYLFRRDFSYGDEYASIRDFTDGIQNSILFLQTGTDKAVSWTRPIDVDHDPASPFTPLGTLPDQRVTVATAIGTWASFHVPDLTAAQFHAMVTIGGGEQLTFQTLARRERERHPVRRSSSGLQWTSFGWDSGPVTTDHRLDTLGLAMHNFHDKFNHFPGRGDLHQVDSAGRPHLSWRVDLLQELGYYTLYDAFHHNEPWNSPHNLSLLDQMPDIFRSAGDLSTSTSSRFHVLSGPDASFGRDFGWGPGGNFPDRISIGPGIRDISDGTSNTILIAELGTDRAVPWTAPDEILFNAADPLATFGALPNGEMNMVTFSGQILTLGTDLLARFGVALASRNGGEILDGDNLRILEAARSRSIGNLYPERYRLRNQLSLQGLAFHNYHDWYNRFPVTSDWRNYAPDGRPYLSWRVHLLPFFEQSHLYSQFRLNEPWDSPHNIQLLDQMPQIYRSAGDAVDSTTTRFQVFTGPAAPFLRTKNGSQSGFSYYQGPRINDFTDGTSNTLLAIEAGKGMAVPWTKPDDLEFDPNDPLGTMGLNHDDVFVAAFADGSVRHISASEVQSVLKALITPSGAEYGGWVYGTPDTTPQGSIRPGISVTGTKDNRIVVTEGKLGAIDVVLDKPGNVTIDLTLSIAGVVLADRTTLTFTNSNWNVPQAVTLKAIDDDLIDGAQSVVMTLSVNDAATTTNEYDALTDIVIPVFQVSDDVPTIVTTTTGGITVTEGAVGQTVSVSLSHQPTSSVTLSVFAANSSQLTVDKSSLVFTAANWNTPQSVVFTAVDDLLADGTVSTTAFFRVTASNDAAFRGLVDLSISASVLDNEVPEIQVTATNGDTVVSEDGLDDTVSVRLLVEPVSNVVINVVASDGTEASVSTSQLTFTPANWNVVQTVTISGVNDALLDGDQLSNVQISVAPQSSGPYLAALTKSVVVKTIDDDAAEIILADTGGSTVVSESGTTDTFTVRLSMQPLGNVVVQVTPVTPTEVSVPVSTLTFTSGNWDQPQSVTVVGVDDEFADGDALTLVTVSISSGSSTPFRLTPAKTISVRSLDNEIAAIVIDQTAGSTVVNESGLSDSFAVSLSARPISDVTVLIDSTNTNDAVLSTQSLIFTNTNWNQPQTVTVTAVDDAIADGDRTTQIRLSVSPGTPNVYRDIAVQTMDVQTIDNDVPGIVVQQSAGSTSVNESGTVDTFSVALSVKPAGSVVVLISSANVAEATVSSASLTFTPTDWDQPQNVSVTGIDDVIADGDQSTAITIAIGAASSAPYLAAVSKTINVATIDNEVAAMILQPTQGATIVGEPGTTDTFAVALASKPAGTVTVLLSSSDPGEATVSVTSLTFTAANWNTPQTVTVTGVNDSLADGNVDFFVSLTFGNTSAGTYATAAGQSLSVTTTDDEVAGIIVTETGGTTIVTEGGQTDSVSVRLSTQPVGDVILRIVPVDSTEVSVSASQLTFTTENWNVAQVVIVSGVSDFLVDGDQNSNIQFTVAPQSSGPFLSAEMQTVAVKTIDADLAQLVIVETNGTTIVSESGGTDTVFIRLSSPPIGPVTVQLSSNDATEFSVSPLSVTFTPANWNAVQSVIITGVDDTIVDSEIVSTLMMSFSPASAGGYATATSQSISVRTRDDDTAGLVVTETAAATMVSESGTTDTIHVRLATQPASDVFVNVVALDTTELSVSVSQLRFTTANWNIAQTVTVTGIDDTLIDGVQLSNVRFSVDGQSSMPYLAALTVFVQVTTMDNDSGGLIITETDGSTVVTESGINDSFTVSLSEPPVGNVVVQISPAASSELVIQNPAITFTPANWNQPQTVSVLGANESVADGDKITLLTLSVNQAISAPYPLDKAYGVTVRNIDNEVPGIVVQQTASSTIVNESGTTDTFSVALSVKPAGTVVVLISSANVAEATVSAASLTFTPADWNQPQTISLTGIDDVVADGDQSVDITVFVSAASSAPYLAAASKTINVIIRDNEIAAMIVQPTQGSTVVSETGSTDTFTVALTSKPTGPVTVLVSSGDPGEATTSVSSLTFTSTDWSTPQTLIVTGVDDSIEDGTITSLLTISFAPGSAGAYGSAAATSISVTTTDNETADFSIVETNGSTIVSESGTTDTVSVQLSNQPPGTVVISVTSLDATEVSVSPATLVFDSTTWNVARTITIKGVDDTLNDGPQSSIVLFSVASSVSQPESSPLKRQVVVTTLDDELVRPVIASPASTTVAQQPVISWTPVANADHYDVWIQNVSTGQNPVLRTLVSGTSFTPASPLGIGDYRVWVLAIAANGRKSPWSLPRDFQIHTPVTLHPLPVRIDSAQPQITWDAVPGAARYDLWINNGSTGQSEVVRETSLKSTSFVPTSPLPLGLYYAWVRGIDAAGKAANWSNRIAFYVASSPRLLSPLNPTFSARPEFKWSPVSGAVSYEVSYRDKLTRTETRANNITGTSWTPSLDLQKGTWEWWVRANGISGVVGLWSAAGTVEIGGRPSLEAIGTTSDRTPLFRWTPTDGAVRYILHVDRIDQRQLRVIRNESLTTNQFAPANDLAPGTYRAWVQAVSSNATFSAWSAPIDFVITQSDVVGPPLTGLDNQPLDSVASYLTLFRSRVPERDKKVPASQEEQLFDLLFSDSDGGQSAGVHEALLLPTTIPAAADFEQESKFYSQRRLRAVSFDRLITGLPPQDAIESASL